MSRSFGEHNKMCLCIYIIFWHFENVLVDILIYLCSCNRNIKRKKAKIKSETLLYIQINPVIIKTQTLSEEASVKLLYSCVLGFSEILHKPLIYSSLRQSSNHPFSASLSDFWHLFVHQAKSVSKVIAHIRTTKQFSANYMSLTSIMRNCNSDACHSKPHLLNIS